ncbi:hypothetical protein CONCODRAFT_20737 [Conidiobolus coronatus NRRL 28638]|uniref:Uncharacterized protein n=1 Tax=Conidiobolus coronatus (strain ATCC 28846 / CBS 209.66 / NRRL 28638) TaxID=796925 RepID=A0A137NRQ3_CONC2|nr:hypothetical protein CONCODRAFT_20737 [Conidiobolus coronatus NRRL 28638]|eukprot:KXN65417.1 hypothetical protein CONCODRAFT_20737 [Conidiobolus coronatus NRRL 28638]
MLKAVDLINNNLLAIDLRPPIDESVREIDMESCTNVCGDKWGKCLNSCRSKY